MERVTSRLRSSDGRDYAYVATFFRRSLGGKAGDAIDALSTANFVDATGAVRTYESKPIVRSAKPNPYTWRSPHTGAVYSDITIFSYGPERVAFSLSPSTPDQEIVDDASGLRYWDGAVDAVDYGSGGLPIGDGFARDMGY